MTFRLSLANSLVFSKAISTERFRIHTSIMSWDISQSTLFILLLESLLPSIHVLWGLSILGNILLARFVSSI